MKSKTERGKANQLDRGSWSETLTLTLAPTFTLTQTRRSSSVAVGFEEGDRDPPRHERYKIDSACIVVEEERYSSEEERCNLEVERCNSAVEGYYNGVGAHDKSRAERRVEGEDEHRCGSVSTAVPHLEVAEKRWRIEEAFGYNWEGGYGSKRR